MTIPAAILEAMARAQRYAAEARTEGQGDLERVLRENLDFARLADQLKLLYGGKITYLHEFGSGKTWGSRVEDRAKAAGGLGISVPASFRPKGKRRGR